MKRIWLLLLFYLFSFSLNYSRETVYFADLLYQPFFYEDGSGAGTEMLRDIFDEIGYDIDLEVFPFARAIDMVNTGEKNAIFCFPNQTSAELTEASKPIMYTASVFIYNKKKFPEGIKFNTLADLKGYKIGSLIGSRVWNTMFEENGMEVKLVRNDLLNLKKLKRNRIDIVPILLISGIELIKTNFPDEIDNFGISKPFELRPNMINFSTTYPGNKKVISDFKEKIDEVDLEKIIRKHFDKYYPNGVVPEYVISGQFNQE